MRACPRVFFVVRVRARVHMCVRVCVSVLRWAVGRWGVGVLGVCPHLFFNSMAFRSAETFSSLYRRAFILTPVSITVSWFDSGTDALRDMEVELPVFIVLCGAILRTASTRSFFAKILRGLPDAGPPGPDPSSIGTNFDGARRAALLIFHRS